MKFYISDTHLGHRNIIKLCGRDKNFGFQSLAQMDETIIKNWNEAVGENDEVYIVGDLIYRGGEPENYLKQLKGIKHLIRGNHDGFIKDRSLCRYFESIQDIKFVNDNGMQVVLFHYPMAEWPNYYRDSVLLYGHIHNNPVEASEIMETLRRKGKKCYNVGADVPYMGMTPRTLKHIMNANAQ